MSWEYPVLSRNPLFAVNAINWRIWKRCFLSRQVGYIQGEIMTPLWNTMCFINGDKGNLSIRNQLKKAVCHHFFQAKTYNNFNCPEISLFSTCCCCSGVWLEFRKSASIPFAWSWSTWSFIKEIKGEITNVRPGKQSAGIDNTRICHFLWPLPLRHPDRLMQHESLLPALYGRLVTKNRPQHIKVRSFFKLFFAGHVPRVRPLEC